MRKLQAFGFVVMSLLTLLSGVADAAVQYRYFRLPKNLLDADSVAATGFIRDHGGDATFALGYVPQTATLPAAWQNALVDLDPRAVARRGVDLQSLRYGPIVSDRDAREDYHTYDTLTDELNRLVAKYPSLMKLESAGRSVQGRDLWLARLASSKGSATKLKLLYVSSMHGDEVTGKELMIYLIRDLLASYGSDPRATALLDNAELFIMPSMNPDGTELEQRWNADGVDLNRDFPRSAGGFDESNHAVETVALMKLFQKHHFLLALNFHGGDLVFNLPWDARPNPAGASTNFGDDALISALGKEYAKANAPMYAMNMGSFKNGVTYGYEWYQVVGGMQDWSILSAQSTHATVELSKTKWPSASKLAGFWKDNRESLIRFFERGLEGVHLRVVDARGTPVPVKVEVSSSKRAITYPDGVVHRPTIAGRQQVKLSASGFRTSTVDLDPWKFGGDYRTITLEK